MRANHRFTDTACSAAGYSRTTTNRSSGYRRVIDNSSRDRRGAAAILMVAMLGVFLVMAAITIDYAYIQLVRTELRAATDASAKAGAEALSRTENSQQAIAAAIACASDNKVAGRSVVITESDIVLGRAVTGANGKWNFQPGVAPFNSLRVNAKSDAVPLFFGNLLGKSNFTALHKTVAGQQEIDVCLCLDRSGSMLFDMTGTDFSYPPNNPRLSNFTAWGAQWRNHLSPPHPTNSRWAVLTRAVGDFYDEVEDFIPPPRTSLVTWGSGYTMPIAPSTVYQAATTDVPLSNATFSSQRATVNNAINTLGVQPMMGGTNLSAGLDRAVQQLTGPNARVLTNKVVILFTDGQWNDGRHPRLAAQDAKTAGIIVHTVSMLTQQQADLAEVAQITGGTAYTTQNEIELRNAFREIAKSLQVVMIE
ncbi:MAG: VWA domain-containing protein [Pirellula sp.]|nr:VWA domain-containing protein [Pirellula sp.]